MQIHLVDATYELFRAHYAPRPPVLGTGGQQLSGVSGLVDQLCYLLRDEGATHVGCATDRVIESFRNDLYSGYKSSAGMPPELLSQFPIAEQAIEALGLVLWPMVEFEADDAIATAAHHLAADPTVERVLITAVDKDMCQCVIGARVVCWDRFKDQVLDEPAVIAKHGVSPVSIPDLLALVGDTADGIPGLEGWGKSSAGKVLTAYRHIPAIPDDHAAWSLTLRGADRLARELREHRADATLYRTLATLRTDCPIPWSPAELAWRGVDRPALAAVCAEIGLDAATIRL